MPSDRLRDASGKIGRIRGLERLAPDNTELLRQHLSTLDGFGLRPTVEFPIDGEIDPASLEDGRTILLLDLSRNEPVPMEWRWNAERSVIGGAPVRGVVLEERTRYAAILTRDVRASDGTRLGRAAEEGDPIDALDDYDVAAFTTFSTGGPTEVLAAARRRLDDRTLVPAPRIEIGPDALIFSSTTALARLFGSADRWGWTETGVAHEHVGSVVHGVLHRTRFRRDDKGTEDPDDETFELDETGAPRPIAHEPIPVTIILPRAPAPSSGYPALIIGHGLGSSRHAMVTFAEPLTEAGYALVGIDMEGHGSRWKSTDQVNNTAMIAERFTGDRNLPDGFGDLTGPITTLELLEGLENLSAVRDSFRQSVLDLSQLAIALRSGAIEGLGVPLDASRLAYLGESFGSVIGGILAGVEPEIELYVLDVGGGGIIDLIVPASPLLSSLLVPLGRSVYGIEGSFDRFHPIVSLVQALLDPADPLSYAPHYFRDRLGIGPRHVVVIEVMHDELMSNAGTEALARAGGFSLLDPYYEEIDGVPVVPSPASGNADGQTAMIVQYAPATHGSNWTNEIGVRHFHPIEREGEFVPLPNSIPIRNPIRETFAQVIELLDTHRNGVPVLRSTIAPRHDFDDDGIPDTDDVAPFTPD